MSRYYFEILEEFYFEIREEFQVNQIAFLMKVFEIIFSSWILREGRIFVHILRLAGIDL